MGKSFRKEENEWKSLTKDILPLVSKFLFDYGFAKTRSTGRKLIKVFWGNLSPSTKAFYKEGLRK